MIEQQHIKRDTLGRRNKGWSKAGPGRGKEFDCQLLGFMVSYEMKRELIAKAKKEKVSIAKKIREYIEWGLENDK